MEKERMLRRRVRGMVKWRGRQKEVCQTGREE